MGQDDILQRDLQVQNAVCFSETSHDFTSHSSTSTSPNHSTKSSPSNSLSTSPQHLYLELNSPPCTLKVKGKCFGCFESISEHQTCCRKYSMSSNRRPCRCGHPFCSTHPWSALLLFLFFFSFKN